MGIPGLTSFVDANSHLLIDHRLRDTRIIIDGNNLYHFLYYNSNVPHQYAGDYDTFSKAAKQFFYALKKCNVSPYVVFDGGYETDDRKLRTVLSRCKERICLAGFLSHGGRAKILPILVEEVFLQVLQELDIKFAVCDFEADDQIASLANLWNCPVLSNDSDFFIFDLSGGYIPLSYFDDHVFKDDTVENGVSGHYLSVQIYFCENLVKPFSLEKSLLALFATMLGNDIVDKHMFDSFYSKVCLPRKSKHKKADKMFSSQRFQKITGLLHWLQKFNSFQEAIEGALSHINEASRSMVSKAVERSIASYNRSDTNLKDYFENRGELTQSSHIIGYNAKELPTWFIRAFREGALSVFIINAVCLHRILLLCQIEDMNKPSSYSASLSLRQILYGILMKENVVDIAPETSFNEKDKTFFVEEYDRENKKQKCNIIRPMHSLVSYGDLPSLSEIPDMTIQSRRGLLLHALDIGQLSCETYRSLSSGMQYFLAILLFSVKHSSTKITQNQLKSMLVGMLNVSCINTGSKLTLNQLEGDLLDNVQKDVLVCIPEAQLTEDEILQAREMLKKFCIPPKQIFDVSIVHAYSQVQTCFHSAVHLNRLLLCPFPALNPACIFNGTFIYNFCQELSVRVNPDLYVSEMLGRNSALSKTFFVLLQIICANVKDSELGIDEKKSVKKSKKRSSTTKKDSNSLETNSEVQPSALNKDSDKKPKVDIHATCLLSNRFGGLTIDDASDLSDED